jgi:hypothetical protein
MARSDGSLWAGLAANILSRVGVPTNAYDKSVYVLVVNVRKSTLLTFDTLRPREELPL